MTNKRIQIAFCFDIRMFAPACVSVASLMDSKNEEDHYDIHCIVDEDSMNKRERLLKIVKHRDSDSSISFYPAPNTFASAYETRGISKATYMRFAIHKIIPNIDKVIYSDVDVLFCDSLKELWETDIENYYFAGVKGTNNFDDKWESYKSYDYYSELDGLKGKYINAGILLMNLRRIRESMIEEEWIERSNRHYEYQDQDIINITCKNQILLLPLKYNLAAYLIPKWFKKYYIQGLYSKKECISAYKSPVILHYAGDKPWEKRNSHRADIWWNYVLSQEDIVDLFKKLKKSYFERFIYMIKNY